MDGDKKMCEKCGASMHKEGDKYVCPSCGNEVPA